MNGAGQPASTVGMVLVGQHYPNGNEPDGLMAASAAHGYVGTYIPPQVLSLFPGSSSNEKAHLGLDQLRVSLFQRAAAY